MADSQQMRNLKRQYNVKTEEELLRAVQVEWSEETGEYVTPREAEVILDHLLEAEYQRIEGGAYDGML